MTDQDDPVDAVVLAFLDYLEGLAPRPTLEHLAAADHERAVLLLDGLVAARGIDPRASRSPRQLPSKTLDGLDVAFHLRLDPSVRQVSDPARQSFDPGRFVREKPEAHALHSSAQDEPSGYEHRPSI